MSITTSYKEAFHNKIFEVISQASTELNVDSYVIGGFVRDLI
jgi:tRNA nucleotidyltransferase (CCA-adding enzyme)